MNIKYLLICPLFYMSVTIADPIDNLFELPLAELLNIQVSTASRENEALVDTPVAVTVITSEMIANSGASSIKRLLVSYVPGFTSVEDQNEVNIAVRGVYTSSQQKILFMLNGHRLNGHSFSESAPDLSLSLDKIKQIEVLRGPASSLYGNVALTAVVNIVLKKAEDSEGAFVKLRVGDHGQQELSYHHGYKHNDLDAFIWLNKHSIEGEVKTFSSDETYNAITATKNEAIIGGHDDPGSYDMGFNIEKGPLSILFNTRQDHPIEPFSSSGTSGETYVYADYPTIKGVKPGQSYNANNMNIQYEYGSQDSWQHETRLSFDQYMFTAQLILDPVLTQSLLGRWKDDAYGLMHISHTNLLGGRLQVGFQIDNYKVEADDAILSSGGSTQINAGIIMPDGEETTHSIFTQYKYALSENWASNIGFRYDDKSRSQGKDVHEFSPRLSLNYKNADYALKMSASRSFVDASYFNRRTVFPNYRGANNLTPEKLTSIQLSPTYYFKNNIGEYNATVFYNTVDNFIFRNLAALPSEANYNNSGELTTWGLEQELWWVKMRWQVRANMTWQKVLDYDQFEVKSGDIANVPSLVANLILDYELHNDWHINGTFQYIGKQHSPIYIQNDGTAVADPFPNTGVSFDDPNNEVAAAYLMHSQLSYRPNNHLRIDLQVDNLFDEQHLQGGTTLHPYPQMGRSFRLAASYDW